MFDPYHRWLAIPADQRPPTHYQLLGISPAEQDPEVIEAAALRQMAHVRTYQIGQYSADSQRILNELSQARTTLLSPQKRLAYDQALAKEQGLDPDRSPPAAGVARPAPGAAAAVGKRVRKTSGNAWMVLALAAGGAVAMLALVVLILVLIMSTFTAHVPPPDGRPLVLNQPKMPQGEEHKATVPTVGPPKIADSTPGKEPGFVPDKKLDPKPDKVANPKVDKVADLKAGKDGPIKPAPPPKPVAPPPPNTDLFQAADIVIPLGVINYINSPNEVLLSDEEHRLAAILDPDNTATNVVLYDLADKRKVASTPVTKVNFSPCRRQLSPDAKYFLQDAPSHRLDLWNLGNPKAILNAWGLTITPVIVSGPRRGHDVQLANQFFVEGDKLLTVTAAGSMEIWQVPAMKSVMRTDGPKVYTALQTDMVDVSRDRRRCAIFTGTSFRVLDTSTGKLVCETEPLPPIQDELKVTCRSVAFSPDGKLLVAGITDWQWQNATMFCQDAVKGTSLCHVALPAVDAKDYRLLFSRVEWFGPEHFMISMFRDNPRTIYRARDGAAIATVRLSANIQIMRSRPPDGRLWCRAVDRATQNAVLVGVPFPKVLGDKAAPDEPLPLLLTGEGIVTAAN